MTALPSALEQLLTSYFSPIDPIREKGASNIFINGHDTIFFEIAGNTELWSGPGWSSNLSLTDAIHMLANSLEQPLSKQLPLLDARLHDGSRVNAVLPPISNVPCVSLRLFPRKSLTAAELIKSGTFTRTQCEYLYRSVHNRCNILVSGCTDSGKTTLIKLLSAQIPITSRLLVLEDTAELNLPVAQHPNMIALEAAHRDSQVTMDSLVINSLRMAPQALILGELRDAPTANAFRTVLNTGLRGILTTMHANNCRETLTRLHDLVAEQNPNIRYETLRENINRNIDIVVSMTKTEGRGRHVREIIHRNKDNEFVSFDESTIPP